MERKPFMEGMYDVTDGRVTLRGCRCRGCGKVFYPAKSLCTACYEENMEPYGLTGAATLLTYTVTRVPVGKLPLPHAVGTLDYPEGVRITAPLAAAESYHIDGLYAPIEDVLYTDEESGVEVMSYKFREVTP